MYIVANLSPEVIAIIMLNFGILPEFISWEELDKLGVKPEQVTME